MIKYLWWLYRTVEETVNQPPEVYKYSPFYLYMKLIRIYTSLTNLHLTVALYVSVLWTSAVSAACWTLAGLFSPTGSVHNFNG